MHEFWCQTCNKKYWFENPVYIGERVVQEQVPFLDQLSQKRTFPKFSKLKGKVKCKNCGHLMFEVEKNEQ